MRKVQKEQICFVPSAVYVGTCVCRSVHTHTHTHACVEHRGQRSTFCLRQGLSLALSSPGRLG